MAREPKGTLKFADYARAIKQRFPEAFGDTSRLSASERKRLEWLLGGPARFVVDEAAASEAADERRFQKPTERTMRHVGVGWSLASFEERFTIRFSYKGLMNAKPASDLVLYSNLIWELQPRTIIEFGALQGGSALWFADQLDALCGAGETHSFDRFIECVSPDARHPRLHFHQVDLRDLDTLDKKWLARAPHPWLVVDDAHANIARLFAFIDQYMAAGDYYVIEDAIATMPVESATAMARVAERLGYEVDSRYTDAFGYNVTSAPNAWLRKMAPGSKRRRR